MVMQTVEDFQYPIPTYNITKDFDWEHPNCELLFKYDCKIWHTLQTLLTLI